MKTAMTGSRPIGNPQTAGLTKPKQKQLGKTKGDLKRRARIIAKEIISGSTETAALKKAGYSDSYARTRQDDILENPKIKATFAQIMDAAGLTDESLAGDIDRLRKFVKKQVLRGKEEDEVVEVADGQVQLGAVKLAVQLKGHLIEKTETKVTNLEDVLRSLDNGK